MHTVELHMSPAVQVQFVILIILGLASWLQFQGGLKFNFAQSVPSIGLWLLGHPHTYTREPISEHTSDTHSPSLPHADRQ